MAERSDLLPRTELATSGESVKGGDVTEVKRIDNEGNREDADIGKEIERNILITSASETDGASGLPTRFTEVQRGQ
ncbi:hypothetical protein [Natrinema ejinorense]|uniref:Uncharacterized protein n=1 Tax=Natrinema ejinorense TaxID=373386 RepID=A0A2A5QU74_9EURY|nr:hypothetical protein [Natrinema ejinorense]PCR90401.1 hypothetical protein CP557_07540 [Natrinema ejinorense]